MKKIYIPHGTIERHDNIYVDELIVNGRLIVNDVIRAKKIYGSGIIESQRINAGVIVADTLDAEYICAKKVIACKIFCATAAVSVGIIAKDYIEANTVKTARLTTFLSQIDQIEAGEIIRLAPKRSFAAALFCSWVVERFMFWRHNRIVKQNVAVKESTPPASASKDFADIQFERIVEDYREKYRKGGYRIVLEAVNGEPEAI